MTGSPLIDRNGFLTVIGDFYPLFEDIRVVVGQNVNLNLDGVVGILETDDGQLLSWCGFGYLQGIVHEIEGIGSVSLCDGNVQLSGAVFPRSHGIHSRGVEQGGRGRIRMKDVFRMGKP